MDGIHDLGGKHGFGPIEVTQTEKPFNSEWEAREWGLSQCVDVPGVTIDWWRHCRELIMPEDYLLRPYLDSWAQTDLATFVDAGVISRSEALSGELEFVNEQPPPPVITTEQAIDADQKAAHRFDHTIEAEPRYQFGQTISTKLNAPEGHTRLPQYARGRKGTIHAYHGAHVFPDLSSRGIITHQHLYSVMFTATELWPEDNNTDHHIFLDLWESYLNLTQ